MRPSSQPSDDTSSQPGIQAPTGREQAVWQRDQQHGGEAEQQVAHELQVNAQPGGGGAVVEVHLVVVVYRASATGAEERELVERTDDCRPSNGPARRGSGGERELVR